MFSHTNLLAASHGTQVGPCSGWNTHSASLERIIMNGEYNARAQMKELIHHCKLQILNGVLQGVIET